MGLSKRITFRLFPILDARGQAGLKTKEHWIANNILNTFDDFTPRYINPPSREEILSFLATKGFLTQADLKLNYYRVKKTVSTQKLHIRKNSKQLPN